MADARIRAYYDDHATSYDDGMRASERWLLGRQRSWAASSVAGRVLDLGIGTGLNLPHYAPGVRVVGVDPSERMLEVARRRGRGPGVAAHVELLVGDAQHLPLGDATMDAVVSTYTLCTVPDQHAAARELARVLRPGGRAVLVEHGPARSALLRAAQHLLDPLMVRWQHDHLLRDPLPPLVAAGLDVASADRAGFGGIVHRLVATRPNRAAG